MLTVHPCSSLQFYISDFTSSLLSVICQPSSALKINGRTFNVIKLLGEGGFSFVYLAGQSKSSPSLLTSRLQLELNHSFPTSTRSEDTDSGRTFALKKIRAPTADSVKIAMSEIEAYRRFKSENIIRSESAFDGGRDEWLSSSSSLRDLTFSLSLLSLVLDSAVLQDESGEGKIIWVFLPFYEVRLYQPTSLRPIPSPSSSPLPPLPPFFFSIRLCSEETSKTSSPAPLSPLHPPTLQKLNSFNSSSGRVKR